MADYYPDYFPDKMKVLSALVHGGWDLFMAWREKKKRESLVKIKE